MKIAAAQIHPRFVDPNANRTLFRRVCKRGAKQLIELLVFPELAVTGYNFGSRRRVEQIAESIPDGPTTQLLIDLALSYKMIITAGLAERGDDGNLYNSAVLVGPAGFIGSYRKIHLFGCEPEFFKAGNQPPQVFKLPDITIGLLVCFDWAFPEVTRILMLEGCDVLCLPSNLVLPYAQRVMIARSIENRIFTVLANRVGTEGNLTFTGHSQITNVMGEVLAKGSKTRTGLIIADIEPEKARNKLLTPTNDIIKNRRIDLYKRLVQK